MLRIHAAHAYHVGGDEHHQEARDHLWVRHEDDREGADVNQGDAGEPRRAHGAPSIYVCMRACTHVHVYACMHVCTYALMHACMHAWQPR